MKNFRILFYVLILFVSGGLSYSQGKISNSDELNKLTLQYLLSQNQQSHISIDSMVWNGTSYQVELYRSEYGEIQPSGTESINFINNSDFNVYKLLGKGMTFTSIDANGNENSLLTRITVRQLNEEKSTLNLPYKVASRGISISSVSRGLLGLVFLVIICFLFSTNRGKINWRLVGSGMVLQIISAILVFKVPYVKDIFKAIGEGFTQVISFTNEGVKFLFGSFASQQTVVESPLVNFAIIILPTVIFFSALTSMLFYFGILQKVVYALAWIMKKTMGLSGSEALAASGNIFLGQTEAPLLIKPYIEKMTRSELMCLMTGGMATIAGGVLAAYIGFLGGGDKEQEVFYAMHLLTASVMSAPAAIVAAKILVPETEEIDRTMTISKDKIGSNFLESISNGTTDGVKLAVNVGAMLLVFTAMVAMFNYLLQNVVGYYTGLNEEIIKVTHGRYSGLNMQFLLGYLFAPVAWILGVPSDDMVTVGQLLGQKTVLNEFYAYTQMGKLKLSGGFIHEKSLIMTTYILCGFSNFASIGIQIGGIGALAPSKRTTLSSLGFRAMIGGTVACLMTATLVGMFY